MEMALRDVSAGEKREGSASRGWPRAVSGAGQRAQDRPHPRALLAALPFPEHFHGHGFLEVQDRGGFRHEEDDGPATRRGQASACFPELSLVT